MFSELFDTIPPEWKSWGFLIIIGVPFAIILAGELLLHLEKRDSKFIPIVYNVRNILLPNLAIYLILSKIMKLGDDSLLLKLAATSFWLVLIFSVLKFVNTLMFSDILPHQIQSKFPKLLVDFIRTFLVLLGAAIIASTVWGADLGKLLAALGVGSVVLGLALQDVLGGLFSGLALLSAKPFEVGDWIKIGEIEGQVKNMDWRSVSVVDFSEDTIVIPNAVIAKETFTNYSSPTKIHRVNVGFDISFDDAPNIVKQVLLEAAYETEGILKEPKPWVSLKSYDEFSVHYDIHFFINDYAKMPKIRDNFVTKVWYINRRYNITFPTRAHEVYTFDGEKTQQERVNKNNLIDILKSLDVFSGNTQDLEKLVSKTKLHDYGVGECLIQRGVISQYFYVIIEGISKEYIQNRNGAIIYEQNLKTGDIFGLASLTQNEPSLVTVCALSDIQVLIIENSAMKDFLAHNPTLAQTLEKLASVHSRKVENSILLTHTNNNEA